MRTKKGAAKARKRKRVFRAARGYWGGRSKLYRTAKESLRRAWRYSWYHRRQKKRDFRRLWITRINAAARMRNMNYSRLIGGLKKADVQLNRKMLAELAISDPGAFDEIVSIARTKMEGDPAVAKT